MTTTLDPIAPATRPSPEALRSAWLFCDCADCELERVAALCRPVEVPAGVTVVHEGARRQPCFVVVQGTAAVERAGHWIGHTAAGGVIGVGELLGQCLSTVTVVAVTDMCLLQLDITRLQDWLCDGFGWSIRHRLEVMTAEHQRRMTAPVVPHSSYLYAEPDAESRGLGFDEHTAPVTLVFVDLRVTVARLKSPFRPTK